ncbi:hypothetical protein FA95DRAFT_932418 [Auriscalpium vulgare]|uniref:Uncharacterized protein n=1 Tax=Auriscalpium vulgare TaxID=40419 RepID=A0ACB8SAY7_9AGAM|nr:hypothetical protein FA95DRAFT_932418 [Auriscalpium vulgare]
MTLRWLPSVVKIYDPAQRPTVSEMKAHAFFADIDWAAIAARTVKPPSVPLPHRVRSNGAGLVIPHGRPYPAGKDPLPAFTYTSPALLAKPAPLVKKEEPSHIHVVLKHVPSAQPGEPRFIAVTPSPAPPAEVKPETPKVAEETTKAPKAPVLAGVRQFFRRHFGGGEKPKALDDLSLGHISKSVIVTVESEFSSPPPPPPSSPSPSPSPSLSFFTSPPPPSITSTASAARAPSVLMDPRRPGLPMLTIWNMVDPPTNPTPIEGLGPDEVFCVLAPVCDSQIARPSSLFLRVLRYDEEQERLKSNPSKTKIQFCNKIQKWFGGIGGGAKAKARTGK